VGGPKGQRKKGDSIEKKKGQIFSPKKKENSMEHWGGENDESVSSGCETKKTDPKGWRKIVRGKKKNNLKGGFEKKRSGEEGSGNGERKRRRKKQFKPARKASAP